MDSSQGFAVATALELPWPPAAAGVRGALPVAPCAEALPPPCFSQPIYRARADVAALAAVRTD